jgi:hypothetical protein
MCIVWKRFRFAWNLVEKGVGGTTSPAGPYEAIWGALLTGAQHVKTAEKRFTFVLNLRKYLSPTYVTAFL